MNDLITRRRVLQALSALLPLPACATQLTPLCPDNPTISDPKAPLTIDVHAHVFNGSDLQIKEFISQCVADDKASELHGLVDAMGSILQLLGWSLAPNARTENRALDRYEKVMQDCSRADEIRRAAAPAFQDGYKLGRRELQTAVRTVQRSGASAEVLGPKPGLPGLGLGAAIESLPPTFGEFEARRSDRASVLGSQPHFLGYIDFVLHHFNSLLSG